jgi:hypothetical protein
MVCPFNECWQRTSAPIAQVIPTNIDFQIEIVPADGIRLPFSLGAETSERRRFLGTT